MADPIRSAVDALLSEMRANPTPGVSTGGAQHSDLGSVMGSSSPPAALAAAPTQGPLSGKAPSILSATTPRHPGGAPSLRHAGNPLRSEAEAIEYGDVEGLHAEISRLRQELHTATAALNAERAQHERTRELLRSALRPTAPDVSVSGMPASPPSASASGRRRVATHSPAAGSAKRLYSNDQVPQFVRDSALYGQNAASPPRGGQRGGTTHVVTELFERIVSTPRGRASAVPQTPGPAPANSAARNRRAASSAATPSARGGAGTPRRASSPAVSRGMGVYGGGADGSSPSQGLDRPGFGSKTDRFQRVNLSGHHGTFITKGDTSLDITREEATKLAKEMVRTGAITPTRQGGIRSGPGTARTGTPVRRTTGGAACASPIFTGVVKASAATQLKSPDIAQWVQQITTHEPLEA